MFLNGFKSLSATLKEFEVFYTEANFIEGAPFVLVEAKQDNFDAAWGQCLAEMIAAQRLNNLPDLVIYGITCNGDRGWRHRR